MYRLLFFIQEHAGVPDFTLTAIKEVLDKPKMASAVRPYRTMWGPWNRWRDRQAGRGVAVTMGTAWLIRFGQYWCSLRGRILRNSPTPRHCPRHKRRARLTSYRGLARAKGEATASPLKAQSSRRGAGSSIGGRRRDGGALEPLSPPNLVADVKNWARSRGLAEALALPVPQLVLMCDCGDRGMGTRAPCRAASHSG